MFIQLQWNLAFKNVETKRKIFASNVFCISQILRQPLKVGYVTTLTEKLKRPL